MTSPRARFRLIVLASTLALIATTARAEPPTTPATTAPAATPAATAPATPPATTPAEAPATTPATKTPARVPDPATWKQQPRPVTQVPRPLEYVPKVEFGADGGVVSRRAEGSGPVSYGISYAVGGHARVDLFSFVAARVHARFEGNSVAFQDGALGLPSGTSYDQPNLHRVLIGFALEPTWSPSPRLGLFAGVGISWSRTIAAPLHTSGAEMIVLPTRSAVFVEYPLSLGARYEVIPRWLVVSAMGVVGFLTSQSGSLLNTYNTPGTKGTLVTVGGFPELRTSVAGLAGIGLLL